MKDPVTTFGRSHTHGGEPRRRSYYGGRRRRSAREDGELLSATSSHCGRVTSLKTLAEARRTRREPLLAKSIQQQWNNIRRCS